MKETNIHVTGPKYLSSKAKVKEVVSAGCHRTESQMATWVSESFSLPWRLNARWGLWLPGPVLPLLPLPGLADWTCSYDITYPVSYIVFWLRVSAWLGTHYLLLKALEPQDYVLVPY